MLGITYETREKGWKKKELGSVFFNSVQIEMLSLYRTPEGKRDFLESTQNSCFISNIVHFISDYLALAANLTTLTTETIYYSDK